MTEHSLHVTVSLASLKATLQRSLQRTSNLVATALQSPVDVDPAKLRIAPEGIEIILAADMPWTQDLATRSYQAWVLASGFRDAVEAMSAFLEESNLVCAVYATFAQRTAAGTMPVALWNDVVGPVSAKRFHTKNLPDKIKSFADRFDIRLDPALQTHLMSANAARNCLVHRRGHVAPVDLARPTDLALVVSWRTLHPILIDADGETDLVLNQTLAKDSMLALRVVDRSKEFPLADSVSFGAEEFRDITYSMTLVADDLISKIASYATKLGITAPME